LRGLLCAMASSGIQRPAVELLGREHECAVIDCLLEGASNGASGALVVRGEAGIGKSALLGYAMQRAAPGMLVLRANGVEAESDLAFAGLGCHTPAAPSSPLAGRAFSACCRGRSRCNPTSC
jgi:AAA ATPase domain